MICLIGISTSYFALQGLGIYGSVAKARENGFEMAELGALHKFEANVAATLKRAKKDFPETHFTLHGLFPPLKKNYWFNPPEGLTATNKKIIKSFFSTAAIVEADLVSFHPGFDSKVSWGRMVNGVNYPKYGKQFPRKKAFENSFKVLGFAQKQSETTGIDFAIENIPSGGADKPLFLNAQDFTAAFERFPNCGLLLDFGHALFSKNLEEMLSLGDKVKQMHVHWSKPQGKENNEDNHLPIDSLERISPLKRIRQLNEIPLIFEHGRSVSIEGVLKEKKLVESFLKNI